MKEKKEQFFGFADSIFLQIIGWSVKGLTLFSWLSHLPPIRVALLQQNQSLSLPHRHLVATIVTVAVVGRIRHWIRVAVKDCHCALLPPALRLHGGHQSWLSACSSTAPGDDDRKIKLCNLRCRGVHWHWKEHKLWSCQKVTSTLEF